LSKPEVDGNQLPPWTGAPILRKEDHRFLVGRGQFVADIARPGLCHAAFARSPHAAAGIVSVDVSLARKVPGVVDVYTAADLGNSQLMATLEREGFIPTAMPLLAGAQVRFVGDPVAVVIADSQYLARDAADLIQVEWAPLPVVTDIDSAQASGAPLVHPAAATNCLADLLMHEDELDTVFASAALVVDGVFTSGRLAATPLECRGCMAEWDDRGGQVVLHASTQVPHQVKSAIAQSLGIPERMIRVVAPDVGGGFGLKCVVGREEVIIAAAALRIRRPVKWLEDRRDNLMASFHGHEQRYAVRAAFTADGRITGLAADIECDIGAYSPYPFTYAIEPLMAASELPGVYKIPAYRARGRAIATNKAPTAPYRGVSRPQIVLVMERIMEKAARQLRIDPLEVRKQNLIRPQDFPYTGVNGIEYDEGSYLASINTAQEFVSKQSWADQVNLLRQQGTLAGIGYSCFSERTGYGTPVMSKRKMFMTPGYDTAVLRMDPTGEVQATTGTCSQGQGHETTMSQIIADRLGIHPAQVSVSQGDTNLTAYGWGTFASRSIVIGGGALALAADKLVSQLRQIAAHLLGVRTADVEIRNGAARRRDDQGSAIALSEIAGISYFQAYRLPPDLRHGLEARATFDPPGTFSNGCHAALVSIDQETGAIRVLRYLVVEDCGVLINPMVVNGQIAGGVMQGIGAALHEGICYGPDGQPLTTTLMDYLVPTVQEMCPIDIVHLETKSAFSETGAKGMGEGGMIGAPAAVINAINDAVLSLGIQFDHIPVLPMEVVRAIAR
jgi:carbon-monoxide dehydrogenase large subunit